MDRYERLSTVLEVLAERGKVEVDALAAEMGVSAATIRRDLDHLADQQLLTRTRGGALARNAAYDLPLRYKTGRYAREKERIGRAAAALVQRGHVVGLNGGTTTTEIARSLATRAEFAGRGEDPALTVVTNALNIAGELAVRPKTKIVVTGGVARPQSFELIGPLATRVLEEIALDILLLGVDAVDPARGAYAHHEGEASINRLMVSRARKVVVVADSSKLCRSAFAEICRIGRIDLLVTDHRASEHQVKAFKDTGVAVQVV